MSTILHEDGNEFMMETDSGRSNTVCVRYCNNPACTGFPELEEAARLCAGPHLSHLSNHGDLQAPDQIGASHGGFLYLSRALSYFKAQKVTPPRNPVQCLKL
jgi:hypothetical protein